MTPLLTHHPLAAGGGWGLHIAEAARRGRKGGERVAHMGIKIGRNPSSAPVVKYNPRQQNLQINLRYAAMAAAYRSPLSKSRSMKVRFFI